MSNVEFYEIVDENNSPYLIAKKASNWTSKIEKRTLSCNIFELDFADNHEFNSNKDLPLKNYILHQFELEPFEFFHYKTESTLNKNVELFYNLLESIQDRSKQKTKCVEKQVVQMILCLLESVFPVICTEQERKLKIGNNYITSKSDIECVYKDKINLVIEVKDINNSKNYQNFEMQLFASMLCNAQWKYSKGHFNQSGNVNVYAMIVFGYHVQFYQTEIDVSYMDAINNGFKPKTEITLFKYKTLSLLNRDERKLFIKFLDYFKDGLN
jgi:hypothetical protein